MRRAPLLLLVAGIVACWGGRSTPLTEAAAAGDRPSVVRLLAADADPNERDGGGRTPLIHAVAEGHFKLVGLLVSKGADADLADEAQGWTPLMHAVHAREMDAVRALLNAGADPNVATPAGVTPLMMAASYGFYRITRLLLERGADPRPASADGRSALSRAVTGVVGLDHITVGGCQTETVRALHEAAPDLRLEEGSWAIRWARLKRCRQIVAMVGPT